MNDIRFPGHSAFTAALLQLLLVTGPCFFELYIFPLIKQLTSVFSCTSTDFWMQGEPFCRLTNTSSLTDVRGQCMDIDRTVACWGPIIWYILRSRCSC